MFKTFLRYLLKPLAFVPALVMIYIIFVFSAQEGNVSSGISQKFSEEIVSTYNDLANKNWSADELGTYTDKIHYYVRKGAHISEYFILAVTIVLPLYVVFKLRGIALILLAGIICVGLACGDEYHQSFVSGRVAAPKDVLIDSIGICAGIICTQIICFIGRKTIFRPLAKKAA